MDSPGGSGFTFHSARSSQGAGGPGGYGGLPSRPASSRPASARVVGQRPLSAGTSFTASTTASSAPHRPSAGAAGSSLVLQTRQLHGSTAGESLSSEQHLHAAGCAFQSSMGDLFEGFCQKLRLDLARDIAQVLGEVRVDFQVQAESMRADAARAESLCSSVISRRDLEQFAVDIKESIKAEVRTESAMVRQRVTHEVQQMLGDGRTWQEHHQAPEAEAVTLELAGLHRVAEDVRMTAKEIQAVVPELVNLKRAAEDACTPAKDMQAVVPELASLKKAAEEVCIAAKEMQASAANTAAAQAQAWEQATAASTRVAVKAQEQVVHAVLQPIFEEPGPAAAPTSMQGCLVNCRGAPAPAAAPALALAGGDCDAVLRELRQMRSQVLKEIGDIRKYQEGDLGAASRACGMNRYCALDVADLLGEIRQLRSQMHVDTTRIGENIEACVSRCSSAQAPDREQAARYHHWVVEELREMREEVRDEMRKVCEERLVAFNASLVVDFCPVLEAISNCKSALDCSDSIGEIQQVVRELRQGQLEANFAFGFQEVLAAVRERGPDADLGPVSDALARVQREQSQMGDGLVSILQELRAGTIVVDNLAVIEAIQAIGKQGAIDRSHVIAAVREAKTELLPLVEGLRDGSAYFLQDIEEIKQAVAKLGHKEVDLSAVINAIHEHKPEVDFTPVITAINDSRAALDTSRSVEEINQAVHDVRELQLQMDSQISKDIQHVHYLVDTSMTEIARTMKEGPIAVDFTAIQQAVETIKTEAVHAADRADLSADIKTILESRPQVDFAPIITAINDSKAALVAELSAVAAAVETIKNEVDLTPVLTAIKDSKAVLQTITEGKVIKAQVDFSQVLQAITEHKTEVDLTPLLTAIQDSREVLQTIMEGKAINAEVDFSPILQAITEHQTKADLTPVLTAIKDSIAALQTITEGAAIKAEAAHSRILQAMVENRTEVDLTPVLAAIGDTRAVLQTITEVDFSRVLQAITEHKTEVDLTPVLTAIKDNKAVIQTITEGKAIKAEVYFEQVLQAIADHKPEVDLMPVLAAIGETEAVFQAIMEGKAIKAEVDFSQVFQAIAENKTEVDLTPVLMAIQDSKAVLQAITGGKAIKAEVDFSQVLQAIVEHKTDVDLTPVLTAIQDSKSVLQTIIEGKVIKAEVDFSQVLQAIMEHKTEVDLTPVLTAIMDSKAVLQTITEGKLIKAEVDFSQVFQAITEHKTEVDFTPVLTAITDSRAVLQTITEGKAIRAEVDISQILQAINAAEYKTAVDLTRVLTAINDSKTVFQTITEGKAIKAEVDFTPVITAIAAVDTSRSVGEISRVVHDVRDRQLQMDFPQLTKEIQHLHSLVDASHAVTFQEMRDGMISAEAQVRTVTVRGGSEGDGDRGGPGAGCSSTIPE